MRLIDSQLAILRFLELADGEGCVLAADIAHALQLKPRGMGNRLKELERRRLVERIVVRERASFRSDALHGWQLTDHGREALSPGDLVADEGGARRVGEINEARQLAARYRLALEQIVEECGRWCDDYAMCDHVACKSSADSYKIALDALHVQ